MKRLSICHLLLTQIKCVNTNTVQPSRGFIYSQRCNGILIYDVLFGGSSTRIKVELTNVEESRQWTYQTGLNSRRMLPSYLTYWKALVWEPVPYT